MGKKQTQEQWFGCSSCNYCWLGGTLPMDATHYQAMFDDNRNCLLCNVPAHHFGNKLPDIDGLTLFYGSAYELLNHPLREEHEREVRQNKGKKAPTPRAVPQTVNNQKAIACA